MCCLCLDIRVLKGILMVVSLNVFVICLVSLLKYVRKEMKGIRDITNITISHN
jgi:hypothetical protein